LLKQEPTHGSKIVGRVNARPGALWISLSCIGDGDVTIKFEPVDQIAVPCGPSDITPTKNQINLIKSHNLTISVAANENVEWSLLVQE
jgi:hypothetical protein